MKWMDAIRVVVLKTNPVWPFSSLNRVPYSLAIRAFVHAFRDLPEIQSIYLRHGMTEEDWVPAISDIDITVIVSNTLNDEQEFHFLRKFWSRYRSLKNIFHMMGEVDVFVEDQLSS